MGRAKMNLELIRKERARHITFQKRKVGLLRKMREFTTLCDVRACAFIINPNDQENSSSQLEAWPEKPNELSLIINMYKDKSRDKGTRVLGLQDFFEDRNRKIGEEIQRVRKKHREVNYPTGMEPMSYLPETQLREFASRLKNKLDFLNSKVESMKAVDHRHPNQNRFPMWDASPPRQHVEYTNINTSTRMLPAGYQPAIVSPLNIPFSMHHGPPIIQCYTNTEQEHYNVNQSSMIGSLMNDTDHLHHQHHDHQMQLFGITPSHNVCHASFMREFYLAPSVGGGGAGAGVAGDGGGVGGAGSGGRWVIQNGAHGHPMPLSLHHHGQAMQPLSIEPYTQSLPAMSDVQSNLHPTRENDHSHVFHFQ